MLRFVGIDVARRTHLVAIVDQTSAVLLKPTPITEDAAGYEKLIGLLGSPTDTLVVMEATGHYWRNLFAYICARDFRCAVLNPLRMRRFAQEDLRRAKTDRTDALTIARFGAQKRPGPTPVPDPVLENVRELVRLQQRLGQDYADRIRQLHRLLFLVFPEFTEVVHTVDSQRATTLLSRYPSAKAFREADQEELARLRCSSRGFVGQATAASLMALASTSVARHHSSAYDAAVRAFCADLDSLRQSLKTVNSEIGKALEDHPLAQLLASIQGLGALTVARLLASLGDPALFRSAAALASYVGVVPATNQSGLSRPGRAPVSQLGNAELRAHLWMPTLVATKRNPWLRAYYERLVARGKPRKLAVVAAMRKLLIAVHSVAKHRRPFVPRVDQAPAPGAAAPEGKASLTH
jgi:transposase